MARRSLLIIALFWGCTIYDGMGWEGVVSLAAVVPADVHDSLYVHIWATGEDVALGPGDSTCTRFFWKANRSAKFTFQTLHQPAFVLLWRTPTKHYPHLTVRVDGDFLQQDPGTERCR